MTTCHCPDGIEMQRCWGSRRLTSKWSRRALARERARLIWNVRLLAAQHDLAHKTEMISSDVLGRVRNGVCAVGYLSVPLTEYEQHSQSPYFQVVGTGFLVRGTTVITNRHVIECLVDEQARVGFPSSQMFLSFVVPDQSGRLRNTVRMIRHHGVLSDDQMDVGFVEFRVVHQLHFEGIAPLEVVDVLNLRVSEEIAVYGYPYGTAMLERDGRIYRWGPVVQQGWISGVSPFETAASPDEILLDVRTASGMSGAPIFRPADGRVIGIHHSGWEATTALGQPINRALLTGWLTEYDGQLQTATGVDL